MNQPVKGMLPRYMKKIRQNCIIPSAAFSVPKKFIKQYCELPERSPKMGDLVYGRVCRLGFHTSLESVSARIHTIHDRTRAVFVFGNRYAPDHYEGLVPQSAGDTVDMLPIHRFVSADGPADS